MKRVVHISKSHEEAREWDIEQAVSMTPAERQAVAKELRDRVYGDKAIDIKEGARSEDQKRCN